MTSLNKYLIISVKYNNLKRGAFTASQRLANEYSQYIDAIDCEQIRDIAHLQELNEQYIRIIFNTQVKSNYSFSLNIVTLKDLNYILYVRNHSVAFENKTCNNGFYYMLNKKINHYIPFITDFNVGNKVIPTIPCIGFYIRNWLTPDSFRYIIDMLSSINEDVNIYTMGDDLRSLNINNKFIKSYNHTFDNKKFFKNVTHYIYPKSKIFQDPLPHSLIEAIQSNCQIIVPTIPGRSHKDGIDDIIEVSNYHTIFNSKINLDNSNTIFNKKQFEKFYLKVFNNNFEHLLDRQKYKYFSDWVEGEVL